MEIAPGPDARHLSQALTFVKLFGPLADTIGRRERRVPRAFLGSKNVPDTFQAR